jgi:hypothetical protein
MLAFKGPAQPSPTLADALNAGYTYLEVRCLGCDTKQTVALSSSPLSSSATWTGRHERVELELIHQPSRPTRMIAVLSDMMECGIDEYDIPEAASCVTLLAFPTQLPLCDGRVSVVDVHCLAGDQAVLNGSREAGLEL